MKRTHVRRRPQKVAVALGAMLATAGCVSAQNATAPVEQTSRFDGGVEQLLLYCGKMRDNGELPTAAGICQRAHSLAPADPRPLMALGQIFAEMDQLPRAAAAYLTVLERTPLNVEARYVLGKTYITMGQHESALQELQFALTQSPEDARIYNALGIANGMLGNQVAARQAFEHGLAVAPNDVPLRNNLGLALVLEGQHEVGIAVLQAVAIDPAANATTIRNLRLAEDIAQTASARQAVADANAVESMVAPGDEQFASTGTIPAEFGSDPEPILSEPQVAMLADNTMPSEEPSDIASAIIPKEPVQLTGSLSHSTADTEMMETGMPVYLDSDAGAPENAAMAAKDPDDTRDTLDRLTAASMPQPILSPGFEMPAPAAELKSVMTADARAAGTQIAALGVDGHYTVQLASYRSAERAQDGWLEIRASALDLLQDIDPVIERSDLGPEKGIFYRLRTKPSSKDAANQLCSALQSRGLSCLAMKKEPTAAEDTAMPTGAKS